MMKKKLILLLLVFVLGGCLSHYHYNVDEQDETILYSFEQTPNLENGNLNSLRNFSYKITNHGKSFSLGILIFVDGILQEYSLDDSQLSTCNTVELEDNEEKTVKIYINSIKGNKEKKHSIIIGGILNSDKIYNLKNYGIEHSISQSKKLYLNGSPDYIVDNNLSVKEHNIQIYDMEDEFLNEKKLDENLLKSEVFINLQQNDTYIYDCLNKNEELIIQVYGREGEYYIYTVYDGNILDKVPYTKIEVKKDKIYSFSIDLSQKQNKNFFVVISTNDLSSIDDGYLIQSEKYIIKWY